MADQMQPRMRSDLAYALIKGDISCCELPRGIAWTEQRSRERYELPVATSRSAAARLVQERLLVATQRIGYQAPPITLRDVTEIS